LNPKIIRENIEGKLRKALKSNGLSQSASRGQPLPCQATDYERIPPIFVAKRGDQFVQEDFIGEQAIVLKARGKGLVVISACAHRGIVNTVRHAQKMTGIEKVHAVIGGFHLTGPMMEPVISPTIEAMKNSAQIHYTYPLYRLEGDQSICQGDGGPVHLKHGGNDLYLWIRRSKTFYYE
jgi:hypothetical protein